MAQKRMFDKTITNSDKFLEMPVSTQNLYFHLSMNADDDGFLDNWKSIIKISGAKEDDLKLLIAKSYIIPFESGVIVIKHWRINNFLRKDRHTDTHYMEELMQLNISSNNEYVLKDWLTDGQPSKDKISKDKYIYINTCSNDTANDISNESLFEAFWTAYPKKKNKGSAEKWFKNHKPTKELVDKMVEMIEKQKNTIDWKKNDGQFIPYPSTWLNAKGWEDEIETNGKVPNWFNKDIEKQEATIEEQQEMEELLKEWK
jgi:hypothetical protein